MIVVAHPAARPAVLSGGLRPVRPAEKTQNHHL